MPKNPGAKKDYESQEKKLVNLGYKLTEAQCRYAIANTTSNAEAAKWLHISYETWRKYAKMYIDEATGISLFELHKSRGVNSDLPSKRKTRVVKRPGKGFQPAALADLFSGKYPNYPRARLQERLIREGLKAERCERCGYQERRVSDWQAPIRIHFRDGNRKNYELSNIEFVCLNCQFLIGQTASEKKYVLDEATGEVVPKWPQRPVPEAEDRRSMKSPDFSSLELWTGSVVIPKDVR